MEKLGWTPRRACPTWSCTSSEGGRDYAPRDYDGRFRGPVRLREALGSSLNVPAVWTVEQLGVDALLTRLRELGFASLDEDARYYGPALALGDGEVTLARARPTPTPTLARGGVDRPLRFVTRSRASRGGLATPRRGRPRTRARAPRDAASASPI